jgi:uncharacterized protein YqgV (UPF0045/DUF77 family)
MRVAAEFLVEPFVEGQPGEHVLSAVSRLEAGGLAVEMGPFGNTTEGDRDRVIDALRDAMVDALENGASRISLSVTRLSAS